MRRPEPGASPIRRALGVVAHEPQRQGPAVSIRWQDLVHDAVREEADQSVPSRSDVDALSARISARVVVAVNVDPQRAAGVPAYVEIKFQASCACCPCHCSVRWPT